MSDQVIKPEETTQIMTLAEMVEETKAKLHLTERDANAFYESSEAQKLKQERLMSKLKMDNKIKRLELEKCITGDKDIIYRVFNERKEDLLAMQRFTQQQASDEMEKRLCEAKNKLNMLQHDRRKLEKQVFDTNNEIEQLIFINTVDYTGPQEQEIRRLQNELDKAQVKLQAAKNITLKYEAIMDNMHMEVRQYPGNLDNLEFGLKQSKMELSEMINLNENAKKSCETALRELHSLEREVHVAKKARDQQLAQLRKEVEKRKEIADRSEKRPKGPQADKSDSRLNKLQYEKVARKEKIIALDGALEKIKKATNVSDMQDIIYRLNHQDETYKQLLKLKKEKLQLKNNVTEQLSKLKKEHEDMKFTSERQMNKAKKVLEEMEQFFTSEQERHSKAFVTYNRNNKLLIDLESGIATLFEKLKEVKLKPNFHNFSRGNAVDDLIICGRKLEQLVETIETKKSAQSTYHKFDSEKLNNFLVTKLPLDNIRIRIGSANLSDSEEYAFNKHSDQENDSFISREDIKNRGQEILNSKLKPKKKKTSKRQK